MNSGPTAAEPAADPGQNMISVRVSISKAAAAGRVLTMALPDDICWSGFKPASSKLQYVHVLEQRP